MWKPEGRRLELSARVVNGSVQGEIFPNLKYGLNRRRFIVAIKEVYSVYLHHLKKKKDCDFNMRYTKYKVNW